MHRMLALILLAIPVSPAWGQDQVDDWDLLNDPATHTTMATAEFDNGIAVAVRCIGGNLDTIITGLPLAERRTVIRTLDYAFGEAPLEPSTWWIGEGRSTIFSDFPAGLARRMRAGGTLQLRAPAEGGEPARRFVVTLPPSTAAIDTVLTACGRALTDRRDELRSNVAEDAPQGLRWVDHPRPEYPTDALLQGIAPARVVLSCLTTESGRLEDCQIESERPAGEGFGQAALRGARRARLADTEGRTTGLTPAAIVFTINFDIPRR